MATHDKRNRIDEIFADGRLIDEALIAAAADAIGRHRRAGVPLVVFQDGHIEHVPADRFAPDIDTLLMGANFAAERTARELIAWFEDRFSGVNRYLLVRAATLEHHDLFKRLFPFVLWLRHLYAGRQDIVCSLGSTASAECDAVVKDDATDPGPVTCVQLATADLDHDESWRTREPLTESSPTKPAAISQEEKLGRTFNAIKRAVDHKSRFCAGPNYVLVVCFDDFMWFGTDDDRAALRSFVSERLAGWRLNVATLYVVGISGRTFESFRVPAR